MAGAAAEGEAEKRKWLGRALLLKRNCELLGVEWDFAMINDEELTVDRERYYEQKAKMRDALEQKLGITVEPFVSYRDLDVYVSNADGEPVTVELAGVITVRVQDLIELAGRLAKHDPA